MGLSLGFCLFPVPRHLDLQPEQTTNNEEPAMAHLTDLAVRRARTTRKPYTSKAEEGCISTSTPTAPKTGSSASTGKVARNASPLALIPV